MTVISYAKLYVTFDVIRGKLANFMKFFFHFRVVRAFNVFVDFIRAGVSKLLLQNILQSNAVYQ